MVVNAEIDRTTKYIDWNKQRVECDLCHELYTTILIQSQWEFNHTDSCMVDLIAKRSI